uniref:Polygalacturonase n=1 Tax=Kalanchoe fedtschenkoi TaxID=63787 RepID=A0A7N1A6B0_KALFE
MAMASLFFQKPHVLYVVLALTALTIACHADRGCQFDRKRASVNYQAINCRKHSALLTDFNAKGDGKTLNTRAFQAAIDKLSGLAPDGGAQLIVPPGKWLTGSFNITSSHFTLFLHKHAQIIASLDEKDYPVLPPLPSYGRGRDADGGRYASLIFGTNLTDVVITGGNGTVNGQGAPWWKKFRAGELKYTRPYLIEIMYSDKVQISDLTLIDAPTWNVHPVYSSNVIVQGLTITSSVESANTDGINPDSCSNVLIQDNYIVSGDDCIAIKSGWDQYGINVGLPSEHIAVKRLTCISPYSAGIALGSEMSGGIRDVRGEDLNLIHTESAVRIKTAVGRGNYVRDIFIKNVAMKTMKYVFWMTGDYGSHPDDGWDRKAVPVVKNVNYRDMVAENVTQAARLAGIEGHPFTGVCMSNVTIEAAEKAKKLFWNCSEIAGVTDKVSPKACGLLPGKRLGAAGCPFPTQSLPIEDVKMKTCSA